MWWCVFVCGGGKMDYKYVIRSICVSDYEDLEVGQRKKKTNNYDIEAEGVDSGVVIRVVGKEEKVKH